jgi:uncharacterized protein YecE (DUF72 family)
MASRRDSAGQLDFFLLKRTGEAQPRRARSAVSPAPVGAELQRLAASLPPDLRLGTSSWSFPGWAGIVYAESVSSQRLSRMGLQAYTRHPLLRAVGIDRTFYAPVPAGDLGEYAQAVGDDFRFLMKAHEACTTARYPNHPRYGAAAGQRNDLFLSASYACEQVVGPFVEGLGPKGGPLLFQLPPQDLGAAGGPPAVVDRLHRFLDSLPRGPLYAVELRDPRLLTPAYRDALTATGAAHCFNVHPTMPDIDTQARRVGTDFPATVVRWMLGGGMQYEQARERYDPFDRIVDADPAARSQITARCAATARAGRAAYVIINNKAEGSAPLSAFALAASIAALVSPQPSVRTQE